MPRSSCLDAQLKALKHWLPHHPDALRPAVCDRQKTLLQITTDIHSDIRDALERQIGRTEVVMQ